MGRHKLDVRYGDRNTLPYYNGVLDIAVINRADRALAATAGKVMSLTTAGRLTPGLSSQGAVPYFSISGLDANNFPDVQRDRGMPGYLDKPTTGIGGPGSPGWPGIPVAANVAQPVAGGWATIRATPSIELSTTAFLIRPAVAAQYAFNGSVLAPANLLAAIYAPGTPLSVVCANNVTPTATDEIGAVGMLIAVAAEGGAATSPIVGHVAPAGVFVGPEGYLTLAFVPNYIPGGTTIPILNTGAINNAAAVGVPLA